MAVGLGASTALPAAATVQWILKDALGQLGGIVAAGILGKRFDMETRKLRIISVVSLVIASFIEISTLLLPSFFLIFASFANLSINICFLSSS